ncbi:MAG: ADP-glyceromanno-heptose 6-epimerase [Planctomycetes bacterium]|jgi:ADP-L-glycero-D-manno-heptose 6-epimerase|nr:ADP-glyceromanno-heptose 6-epimerase [Planctomycetota bacterium]
MNIVITGGAGFVGANLTRTLQEQHPDAKLLVIDDLRVGTFANLSGEGPTGWTYRGDFIARPLHELDFEALCDAFAPDVVYHEASITDTTVTDEAKMIADNVEPFEVMLGTCIERGIRLVWASSAATYGTTANGRTAARQPFNLDDAGRPANVYGFSKWIMENLQRRALAEHPEAHVVGLRYFNVFGPGEQNKGKMASMIYQLAQQMLAGRRPRIFNPGDQARDQVYVKDVVGCTLAAAQDGAASGIYNVGTGEATSFNQIVAALNEALGTSYEPDYFENPYAFYQDYTCADLSQTKAGLNWSPNYTTHDAIVEYAQVLHEQAR